MIKPIENYPDYFIDNRGNVFSIKSRSLKPLSKTYRKGYVFYRLSKDGKRYFIGAHRLVLMTFRPIDNCDSFEVNHINKIRDDNRLENLEWLTRTENVRYSRDGWSDQNVYAYFKRFGAYSKKYKLKFEWI